MRFLLLFLLPLVCLSAQAQDVKTGQIRIIMESSGIDEALDSAGWAALQQMHKADPAFAKQMIPAIREHFLPDTLKKRAFRLLFTRLDDDTRAAAAAFHTSPTGIKVEKAEEVFAEAHQQEKFTNFVRQIAMNQNRDQLLNPQRMAAIDLLEARMGTGQHLLDRQLFTAEVIYYHQNEAPTPETWHSYAGQTRERLQPSMYQQAILMMFFAYRDLPLDTLKTYSAFMESPTGQRYSNVVRTTLRDVLRDAFIQLRNASEKSPY